MRAILEDAGFADVAHEAVNGPIRLAGDSVDEALELSLQVGPVGAALREARPRDDQRARVIEAVRKVIEEDATAAT
mgnify:CR=1 FL=1